MDLQLMHILRASVASVVFALVGMAFFALAFWLIAKSMPFSLRREVEETQNVALAVVIGAVILGIAMILSAALHG